MLQKAQASCSLLPPDPPASLQQENYIEGGQSSSHPTSPKHQERLRDGSPVIFFSLRQRHTGTMRSGERPFRSMYAACKKKRCCKRPVRCFC